MGAEIHLQISLLAEKTFSHLINLDLQLGAEILFEDVESQERFMLIKRSFLLLSHTLPPLEFKPNWSRLSILNLVTLLSDLSETNEIGIRDRAQECILYAGISALDIIRLG